MDTDKIPDPPSDVERPLDKTDRARLHEVARLLEVMTLGHDSYACRCRLCNARLEIAGVPYVAREGKPLVPVLKYVPRRPGGILGGE